MTAVIEPTPRKAHAPMTWFQVDDGFYDHPKVKSIPRGNARKGAVALWTMAGSWSGRYGKDGLIPAHQIEEFSASKTDAEWLVAANLWHTEGHDCGTCPDVPKGHYLYHQWDEHQLLKEEVERRKHLARERARKFRKSHESDSPVRDLFAGSNA